jgi:hypothetical protein
MKHETKIIFFSFPDNVKVAAPCGGYRIPKLCRNKRNKNEEGSFLILKL